MGRKPVRSRRDYAAAALAYVDEHGPASLSARTLGEYMGVDPMTLYRHFGGMDELAGAVIDQLFGLMLEHELPAGTPRERLRAHLAEAQRAFSEHPNAVPLLLNSTGAQPNCDTVTRIALQLLRELGLSGRNLVVAHQLLETHLVGSHAFNLAGAPSHLEIRRQRRRRLDDLDIDQWNRSVDDVDTINREAFAIGLDALLDCCEALAASTATEET